MAIARTPTPAGCRAGRHRLSCRSGAPDFLPRPAHNINLLDIRVQERDMLISLCELARQGPARRSRCVARSHTTPYPLVCSPRATNSALGWRAHATYALGRGESQRRKSLRGQSKQGRWTRSVRCTTACDAPIALRRRRPNRKVINALARRLLVAKRSKVIKEHRRCDATRMRGEIFKPKPPPAFCPCVARPSRSFSPDASADTADLLSERACGGRKRRAGSKCASLR